MDMNEAVAKAIGAERNIAGLTVRKLSEQSKIPLSSLMRVLSAEREIKVNQVADVAAALNLLPHEIVEHAETILSRSHRTAPVLELVQPDEMLAARDSNDDEEAEAQQREP